MGIKILLIKMLGKNELSLLKNIVEGVTTSTKDSLWVGTVGRRDALKENFLNESDPDIQ